MLSKFSGSRQDQQFVLLLVILLGILGISLFLAVSMGSVAIDLGDTYRIILNRLGIPLEIGEVSKSTLAIVWNMRFPRVLLGLIVGAGLSMCGSVMQSTVNNPIAEPYVLGISAGATLGATLSIILGLKVMISLGAFLGAILATIAVLIIASMQGRMTTSSLILSGTVVNALFLAFSNFIISVGANADSVMTIKFWTMGSLAGTSWADLVEAALTLGIPLRFYWYLYVTMVAVLTAVLVATCGIIGFVGLITPHLARGLVGTSYKKLFPVATLLGALFVIWADVLSRIIIPNAELPIGIFTALVGAPFFIYIVGGRRREVRV